MRFTLLFTILICTLGVECSAQTSFGLRAGVNATNADVEINDLEIDTEGKTDVMAGVFFDIPVLDNFLSLQPELNYLDRSYEYGVDNTAIGDFTFTNSTTYLELGLLLKLNLGNRDGLNFYVGAGPTYGYALSGSITPLGDERDIDFDVDRYERGILNFAAMGGIAINLGGPSLFVEARYNGTLTDDSEIERENVRRRYVGINGGVLFALGQ